METRIISVKSYSGITQANFTIMPNSRVDLISSVRGEDICILIMIDGRTFPVMTRDQSLEAAPSHWLNEIMQEIRRNIKELAELDKSIKDERAKERSNKIYTIAGNLRSVILRRDESEIAMALAEISDLAVIEKLIKMLI